MTVRHRCPICHVETKRGQICFYHNRNRARVEAGMIERRVAHFAALIGEAVDEARVSEPPPRRNYHRDYYARNLDRRRMQAREAKRRRALRRRLDPLIRELAAAVDLGRTTARW